MTVVTFAVVVPDKTTTGVGVSVLVVSRVEVTTSVEVGAVIVEVDVTQSAVLLSVAVNVGWSGARLALAWPARRSWRSRRKRSLSSKMLRSLTRNLAELAVGSSAAAWTRVGVMRQVGSGLRCGGGIEQLAVTHEVVRDMAIVGMVLVMVSSVFVVVTVTRLGVTVRVGETVLEGSVSVDCGRVVVAVSVSTEVEFMTGVVVTGTTTVGV